MGKKLVAFVRFDDHAGLKSFDPAMKGTSGIGEESKRRAMGNDVGKGVYVYNARRYKREAPLSGNMYTYIGVIPRSQVVNVQNTAGFMIRRRIKAVEITSVPHIVKELSAITKKNPYGGCTYNLYTGKIERESGYSVSVHGTQNIMRELDERKLMKFIIKNAGLLLTPEMNIGTWCEEKTGKWYVDVSTVIDTLPAAVGLAHRNEQLGIWGWKEKDTIVTGTYRDYTHAYLKMYPPSMTDSPAHSGFLTGWNGITGTGI